MNYQRSNDSRTQLTPPQISLTSLFPSQPTYRLHQLENVSQTNAERFGASHWSIDLSRDIASLIG